MGKQIIFQGVKDGDTFQIAGMEFIKFPSKDVQTPVVMKDIAFWSDFGENNDLRASVVLKRMKEEVLPKIIEAVGAENVCTFKTDLTTHDGLKPYEDMEAKISLPTMDFYRDNVAVFDQHMPDEGWWLATPESTLPHDVPEWILCVSPLGDIDYGKYYFERGVRPFLILNSSIFKTFDN